jgi:hypothetical protein
VGLNALKSLNLTNVYPNNKKYKKKNNNKVKSKPLELFELANKNFTENIQNYFLKYFSMKTRSVAEHSVSVCNLCSLICDILWHFGCTVGLILIVRFIFILIPRIVLTSFVCVHNSIIPLFTK